MFPVLASFSSFTSSRLIEPQLSKEPVLPPILAPLSGMRVFRAPRPLSKLSLRAWLRCGVAGGVSLAAKSIFFWIWLFLCCCWWRRMGDDGRDSWTGRSVETQTELRLGSTGLSLLEERVLKWMPRLCSVSAKPVWRRKLVRRSCSVICCLSRNIDNVAVCGQNKSCFFYYYLSKIILSYAKEILKCS